MTDKDRLSGLDRRISLQRLALFWERLWPTLHWPLVVAGLSFAVIASGLLQHFNAQARLGSLVSIALLLVVSLKPLFGLLRPTRLEAMRRMEQDSRVRNRALSSVNDNVAVELNDPGMDAIWEEHQRRQLLALDKVKVSPPRSGWRFFDPQALRVPVALAALAAFLLGPGDVSSNLRQAAQLSPPVVPKPLTIDAWLKPPPYTGKPPLLLTTPAMTESLASGNEITVPENSVFSARVSGANMPALVATDSNDQPLAETGDLTRVADDTLAAEFKVTRPMTITLSDAGGELVRYPITVIPDAAPTIEVAKQPYDGGRGTLVVEWLAKDDYGVRAIAGDIALADEQDGGMGFDSNGVFLFDPPKLKLSLRRANAREDKGKATNDFAAHPWAGLKVSMTLTVKDAAGQEGTSGEIVFKLPERQFVRPLAQALIEQRKTLILYPEKSPDVADLLGTLMLYPAGLTDRSGPVIAVSTVISRLRNVRGYGDVKFAIGELWDIAVAIEEGSLGDARAELLALKKELEKALQDGAPPERIAELMKELREAMNKFMEQMQREAERRMQDGTLPRQQNQQGRMVTEQDLQKMLDALEEMAKGGAKDMSQQMLDQLEQMLQNMEPGMAQQQGEGGGPLSEMLDQLGQMMQRQQRLMDDTLRMQGQGGQDGDPLGEQGQQGEEGNRGQSQGRGEGGLADQQQALRGMLDRLLREGQGNMPRELGQALEDMQGAEDGLRNQDTEQALREQGEALDNLRRGANRMAQQLRENGQGQAEGNARDGEGRGGNEDPLGRPRATRNPDTGPDKDMVPSELAIRKAREILEMLRSRSNEQGLTDGERGYLERLLRGLY